MNMHNGGPMEGSPGKWLKWDLKEEYTLIGQRQLCCAGAGPQATWELRVRFFRNFARCVLSTVIIKNSLIYPLLGIYLKKTKTLIWEDTCTPMFIAALFTVAKIWSNTCPSTDEWIKKTWYVYTHTHVCSQWNNSHKKERNSAICSNVAGPRDYYV